MDQSQANRKANSRRDDVLAQTRVFLPGAMHVVQKRIP